MVQWPRTVKIWWTEAIWPTQISTTGSYMNIHCSICSLIFTAQHSEAGWTRHISLFTVKNQKGKCIYMSICVCISQNFHQIVNYIIKGKCIYMSICVCIFQNFKNFHQFANYIILLAKFLGSVITWLCVSTYSLFNYIDSIQCTAEHEGCVSTCTRRCPGICHCDHQCPCNQVCQRKMGLQGRPSSQVLFCCRTLNIEQ